MKKFTFFLIVLGFALGLESFGQLNALNANGKLIYGPLDYTGFQKIKKGAMWAKRPWVKTLFDGGTVEGCETITLQEDHFGMFALNENNELDRNFIIFPAGSEFGEKNGELCYLYCGNKIQTLRPVSEMKNMVSGVEKGITILHDTVWVDKPNRLQEVDDDDEEVEEIVIPDDKTWWEGLTRFQRRAIRTGTALAIIGGTGFVAHDKNHKWYFWFPKGGNPHGTMSGGRPADAAETNTGGDGGRGN